jgi:hypothetical protein
MRVACRKRPRLEKHDPSRFFREWEAEPWAWASHLARRGDARPGGDDRRAADPDDQAAQRDCADGVGGRRGVVRYAHGGGKGRCNTVARDHTRDTKRSVRHSPARGKSVAGTAPPCPACPLRHLLQKWTKAADNDTISANVFSVCVPFVVSSPKQNPGCVNNRGCLLCGTGGQKGMRQEGAAPAAMRMRLRRCYCRFAFPRSVWNATAVNFSTFSNARLQHGAVARPHYARAAGLYP